MASCSPRTVLCLSAEVAAAVGSTGGALRRRQPLERPALHPTERRIVPTVLFNIGCLSSSADRQQHIKHSFRKEIGHAAKHVTNPVLDGLCTVVSGICSRPWKKRELSSCQTSRARKLPSLSRNRPIQLVHVNILQTTGGWRGRVPLESGDMAHWPLVKPPLERCILTRGVQHG